MIEQIIITIYFWTLVAVGNVIAGIIIFPGWIFNQSRKSRREIIEVFTSEFPTLMMRLAGFWNISYTGFDKMTPYSQSYIIVSNHLSVIDTMFIAQLPFDKVFTWKKKWSYAPIFGQICLMAGHITIDPSSDESKRNALVKSGIYLDIGTSVIFYPEGTRGNNVKQLLPFKTGAFRLAITSKKPILPITLIGTKKACNGWICNRARIEVIVDDPISVTSVNEGVEKVRSVMENNYK